MSPAPPLPTILIQRASGTLPPPYLDHASAKWTCCTCHTITHVYIHPGTHPLGKLACACAHKPCSACTTTGRVRPFLPIEEPAMVPCGCGEGGEGEREEEGGEEKDGDSTRENEDDVDMEREMAKEAESEKKRAIPFGTVCPACGLSWRARESGTRFSKTLRKMPSVSLASNSPTQLDAAPALDGCKLRRSRSSACVAAKRIVTPPGEGLGKQAEYVAVRFSGFECLCGETVGLGEAFCFQVGGKEEEEERRERERERFWGLWEGERGRVGWSTTEELRGKGHGEEVLRLGGGKVEHPNPLRSAPVVDRMARESWEEKCEEKGWV